MILKSVSLYMLMGVSLAASLGCFSSLPSGALFMDTYTYQSVDHCTGKCPGSAYIAFRNGNECFCLDSLPTSSTSGCNIVCFGYGQQTCGGTSAFEVYPGPGGGGANAGASSKASTSATSATSSSSLSTSTSTSKTQTSVTNSQTASSKPTSTDATTSDATSEATSDGFVTVTRSSPSSSKTSSSTSSTSSSSETPSHTPSSKKSTNIGPIVGGVVGGIAAIALIAVGIFLCLRYRRDDDDDEEEFHDSKPSALGRGNTSKGSKRTKTSPLDMPMTNPFVHPSDATAGNPQHNSGIPGLQNGASGPSGLMDPRLNPIMMGRRRLSEGSLADEADYSRKILHVANPDA